MARKKVSLGRKIRVAILGLAAGAAAVFVWNYLRG